MKKSDKFWIGLGIALTVASVIFAIIWHIRGCYDRATFNLVRAIAIGVLTYNSAFAINLSCKFKDPPDGENGNKQE